MIQNDRLINFSLPWNPLCIVSLLMAFLLVGNAWGQRDSVHGRHLPPSFARSVRPFELVEQFAPQPFDLQSVLDEDARQRGRGGPRRFAVGRPVEITPDEYGMWERIDDETLLWRLQVTSPEAVTIHLGFAEFFLPSSASLHIYSVDHDQVLGPFTQEHNKPNGRFWTPIIESDDIVIELAVDESELENLSFELTSINHGYRKIERTLNNKSQGASDSCNVNVACSQGDPWRDQSRSVAMYSITGQFSYTCTGTLVNNTAENAKPYFLTAFHCLDQADGNDNGIISDPEEIASSVTVYWNYQAGTCNGTSASMSHVQTGSTYRAGYDNSDFALLELDDNPSPLFDVFYAGWDRNSTAPSSAVTIHHPSGDMKKISIEDDPLSVTMFGETSVSNSGTHLRVADWDLGTTEGGSSGSALFNSNKRFVGQLHGGDASCGNNLADWFGRFYASWNGGGTSTSRLRDWLDPIGSSAITLDGIDSRVPVDSYESDDNFEQARLIHPDTTQNRSIVPATDIDWIKFTLDTVSEVEIQTSGSMGNTRMWLFDEDIVEIDFDDDSAEGSFSWIHRQCGINALLPGTYYIKIDEDGNDDEISSYDLDLTVTPASAADLTGDCFVDFADLALLADDWMQCRTYAYDKLRAYDSTAGDYYGRAVAISGDYAVVGSPYDSDNGSGSGSAYIYRRSGSSWFFEKKITSTTPAQYDFFGFSVAVDGDCIVIGARGDNQNGTNSGAAFVFRRINSTWSYHTKIVAPDGQQGDYFGYSVSVSGDYALIGAPYDDDSGYPSGSAYVFKRSLTAWQFKDKLVADDAEENDNFAKAVSINGNYAVIGSYHDDDDGSNSGSAYVFAKSPSSESWSQDAKLKASDASPLAVFGSSVSIRNLNVIVGASAGEGNVEDAGAAYIFERDDEGWFQQAKLIASDGQLSDYFGVSVAMADGMAIVGANRTNDKGDDSGSAYVFVREEDQWVQQSKLLADDGAENDKFGQAVSISRRSVIVGAFGDSDYGDNSGSAHIFQVGKTSADISPDGCVNMTDLVLLVDDWLDGD